MVSGGDELESHRLVGAGALVDYGAAGGTATEVVSKKSRNRMMSEEHCGHTHEQLNPLLRGKPLRLAIQILVLAASCMATASFVDKQIREHRLQHGNHQHGDGHDHHHHHGRHQHDNGQHDHQRDNKDQYYRQEQNQQHEQRGDHRHNQRCDHKHCDHQNCDHHHHNCDNCDNENCHHTDHQNCNHGDHQNCNHSDHQNCNHGEDGHLHLEGEGARRHHCNCGAHHHYEPGSLYARVESLSWVLPCSIAFLPSVIFSLASLSTAFKKLRRSSRVIHAIDYFSVMTPIVIQATPLLACSIDLILCHGLTYVDVHVLTAFAVFGAAIVGHPAEAAFLTLLFRLGHGIEELASAKAMRAQDAFDEVAPRHAAVLDRAVANRLYDLAANTAGDASHIAMNSSPTSMTTSRSSLPDNESPSLSFPFDESRRHEPVQILEAIKRQLTASSIAAPDASAAHATKYSPISSPSGAEATTSLDLKKIADKARGAYTPRNLREVVDAWEASPSFSLEPLGSLPSSVWSNKAVGSVQPGVVVRVKDGELVPLKSTVLPGNRSLRVTQPHVNGETVPYVAVPGVSLAAGSTLVEGGPAYLLVTHTDAEGEVGQLRDILKEATDNKPRISSFFDTFSGIYSKTMIVIVLLIVFGLPRLPGRWKVPMNGLHGSVMRGIGFVVAGAPCALVMATPIAYWSMYTACMRQMVTLANLRVIDDMASITDVVFDKTGTLTTNMVMSEVVGINLSTFETSSTAAGPHWIPKSSEITSSGGGGDDDELRSRESLLRIAAVTYVLENEISKQPHAVAARRWAEDVMSAYKVTLTTMAGETDLHAAGKSSNEAGHDDTTKLANVHNDQDVPDGDESSGVASIQHRKIQINKIGQSVKDQLSRGLSGVVSYEGRKYKAAVGSAAFVADIVGVDAGQIMAKLKGMGKLRGVSLAGLRELDSPDDSSSGEGLVDIQVLLFRDELRRGAVEAVKRLQKMGITVHIASGDRLSRVLDVAKAVGVDPANVKANVSPGDKLALVKNLGKDGRVVSMVGDEINDAGAMLASAVGVAIGDVASPFVSSTDVAKVIINENSSSNDEADLVKLPIVIDQARWSRWIVAENLVIAGVGLLVVAPASVAAKIPFWLTVIGHEGGSLLVAFNSLRLLKL